ncbi:CDP-diacylglycerol--serine O-phosphatidyltransferase [Bacillus sp. FJAT-27225]|uniref:CDP-diacylglycerol--serine O-phosphatidyltransferase n=1 Tax=Bacillus sp. FJAT-27225 TaxID=1743144 RepID=UPI00080C2E16|nr:CDP-diacylglycerol--serine O-phosphatidyltransferase [Bacillus sp. FJAT-27225]OCA87728.1 CDP-diacylglycerol--serine O-phosphatidyltransferase [Bacillus sp. FJAT-27225]
MSKKRYIPNAFTFGNLFCGFLSIGYIMNGDIRNATILIFIAMMLDALDGRVARILGVSNEFGKELDSLADVVSFGVVPAYLAVHTYFADFGMTGMVLAGIFPLFGAYRLARFNLTQSDASLNHFQGVPITFAGGLVTFLILFHNSIPVVLFAAIYLLLCYLMASTLKIPSFKSIPLPRYGVIITAFIFYMTYRVVKANMESVPIFFWVALGMYIVFMVFRFIKEKEIKLLPIRGIRIKKFNIRRRKKKQR